MQKRVVVVPTDYLRSWLLSYAAQHAPAHAALILLLKTIRASVAAQEAVGRGGQGSLSAKDLEERLEEMRMQLIRAQLGVERQALQAVAAAQAAQVTQAAQAAQQPAQQQAS